MVSRGYLTRRQHQPNMKIVAHRIGVVGSNICVYTLRGAMMQDLLVDEVRLERPSFAATTPPMPNGAAS